jgi:hypothetical protein
MDCNIAGEFNSALAHAIAIDQSKAAVFAAAVVADNPTGPDMFSAGLHLDGSDLPGAPLARHTSSTGVN